MLASQIFGKKILNMNNQIHWVPREKENFLEDNHPDVNTFIVINESTKNQIDFIKSSYSGELNKYDNIFTVSLINEYISVKSHILYVYGMIGYSEDCEEVEFIYDKKNNKIYVANEYRLLGDDIEYQLFKDSYEICYDKYWKINDDDLCDKLSEMTVDEKYEAIDDDAIPYYRYQITKDGISIPRIIYNLFKVFSDPNVAKENKPKIIIPLFHCKSKKHF
jgi:hypothetical protein